MGASYWARWTSSGHLEDLPSIFLSCVLGEGYELLTYDGQRQVFDRGGVMKKIAWSLNGGRWSDAPVDLTITYSLALTKTTANFHWRLSVPPLPTTRKEQTSFETWVRGQLDRIVASADDQVEQPYVGVLRDETLRLQACHGHGGNAHLPTSDQMIGVDAAVRSVRTRSSIQYASTYVETPPQCDRCLKPAVAIPGTTGRYYCLTCHRHLPRRVAAGVK